MSNLYIAILLISSLFSLMLALIALKQKNSKGKKSFFFLMISSIFWSLGYAFELLAKTEYMKLFWFNFQQIGIYYSSLLWLTLSIEFSSFSLYLSKKYLIPLFSIPAIHILLNFTNEYHNLIRKDIYYEKINDIVHISTNTTFLFSFFMIFYYSLLFTSFFIFIHVFLNSTGVFKKQIKLLIGSIIIPLFFSILVFFNLNPFFPFSPTSVTFIFSGLIILYALNKYKLFDLYPIAKEIVFDKIKVGIILIDNFFRINDINPYSMNIFNLTNKTNILGTYIKDLHQIFTNNLDDLIIENSIKINNDYYEISYTNIVDKNNHLLGYIINLYSITEKEQALNALKNKTKDLNKAKLRAEELDKIKDIFLANISHELRTPLTAVLGLSELLINMENDENKLDLLQSLHENGNNLLELIDDLLDISKLNNNKMKLNKQEFDFFHLLNKLEIYFRNKAKIKNIVFKTNFSDDLPLSCFGDKFRLEQILKNLLNNAIKFTDAGYVSFSVSRPLQDHFKNHEYDYIEFIIEDTGIGIDKELIPYLIKEKFKQGEFYLTKKYNGTGLGLNISVNLIELMNGYFDIETKLNKGTKIIVGIPFVIR